MTTSNQPFRIMVVDDAGVTRVTLSEALRLEGYRVATAASGEEALGVLEKRGPFDLVILDLKMPGIDGLEVARRIRHTSSETIIILLTAFGNLETAIEAIREGAHDYLLKPATVPRILESVERGLNKRRRSQQRNRLLQQLKETVSQLDAAEGERPLEPQGVGATTSSLAVRDVVVDHQMVIARRNGEPLDLTPTEFKILCCLMETPDEVWSSSDLVRETRGYEADRDSARAIIRVHIRRLRKKLESDPSCPTYVVNVRNAGYMFASTSPAEEDADPSP